METPVDMTFSIVILTSSDYDSGDINKYKKHLGNVPMKMVLLYY